MNRFAASGLACLGVAIVALAAGAWALVSFFLPASSSRRAVGVVTTATQDGATFSCEVAFRARGVQIVANRETAKMVRVGSRAYVRYEARNPLVNTSIVQHDPSYERLSVQLYGGSAALATGTILLVSSIVLLSLSPKQA